MSLTKASFSMITGSVLNVLDYGADPTGVADSTSAIQTALNAAAAYNGAILFFPKGTYSCANTLSLSSTVVGLSLVGEGADNTNLGGSRIIYSGASSSPFFSMSATNTRWCNIRMLDIRGTNASATGNLLSVSIFNGNIEDCHFSMVSTAAEVVNINNSIDIKITRCYVRGGTKNIVGSGNNAIVFDQCDFGSQTDYSVGLTTPAGVSFKSCAFEGDATGAKASGIYVTAASGLTVQGCWLGDVATVSGSPTSNWISFSGTGLNVIGNYFNGDGYHLITPVFINATSVGVLITGNYFSAFPTIINVGSSITKEVVILANNFLTVDAIVTGTIASGGSIFSQGYLYGTEDGSIHTNHFVTIPVTVATLPNVSTNITGARSFVTDATSTTYGTVVAGGGSNAVPVFCNGSQWIIG